MSFLPYDALEPILYDSSPSSGRGKPAFPLAPISPKRIRIPKFNDALLRTRIDTLLAESERQFPATLICGRSGTGKTYLAGLYAGARRAAWFSVEPPDANWHSFAAGFSAAIHRRKRHTAATAAADGSLETIAAFLETSFGTRRPPRLVVLDNIHHLFDTDWFGTFLEQAVSSVPPNTHLLLLSRSKPPTPIWRMRSKRFLNVIDEKVYGFNENETVELFRSKGLSPSLARSAFRSGFGNIEQMLRVAGALKSNRPPS